MTDNKNNAFDGDDFLDKSFDKDPSDIMSMSDDELQQVAPQEEQESQENNADWESVLKEYESELAKKEEWINDIMKSIPEQAAAEDAQAKPDNIQEEVKKKDQASKINDCTNKYWQLRAIADKPGEYQIRYDDYELDADHKGRGKTSQIVKASLKDHVYTFETISGSVYRFSENKLAGHNIAGQQLALKTRFPDAEEIEEENTEEEGISQSVQPEGTQEEPSEESSKDKADEAKPEEKQEKSKEQEATIEYDQAEQQEQTDEIDEPIKQKAEKQQPNLDLNEKKSEISQAFKNLFEAGKDAVKNGALFAKDKITEFIKGDPDIGQLEEAEYDKKNNSLSFGSKIKTESGDEINAKFIIKNMNKDTKGIAKKLAKNKKVNPSRSIKTIGDLSKRGTIKIWATTPEGKKVCVYELKKGFLNTATGFMRGKIHPQPELGWDEKRIADFAEKLGLPVKRKNEQNVDIVLDDSQQAGRDSDIDRMKAQQYEDKAKVEQEKLNKRNADAFQSSAQSDTSQNTEDNISRASENQKIQNDIDEVHMAEQHIEKQEQKANSGNKAEKAGAKTDPAKKIQNGKSVIQEDVTPYKTIGVTVHPHDFQELENLGAMFDMKKEKWVVPNEPKVLANVERFLSPEESSKRRADEIANYRKKPHEQKQEQQRSQGKGRGR